MKTYGYYPGCSDHGSGRELGQSIHALANLVGVELTEVDDWNCCGATAAHNLNHDLAVALPYRVLALAEAQGMPEILAPCAACFSRLKGTNVRVKRSPELAAKMQEITGLEYKGTVVIRSVIEFINVLLAEGLKDKLTTPLGGMKVAAYYGCLLSRGEDIIEDDAENPSAMTAALKAAGCEIVPWNFATECCGGGFSMSMTDAVVDLSNAILSDATAAGAEAIVTGCPMCHSNLDMRQLTINARGMGPYHIPVMYLSEVVGLAAGLDPKVLGLDRHFVDAMRVAERKS
ncbi:MAG: CoB--CoM heterodisulfide reductase iron-sulfur subunit B family protein [Planctomycetes bacterium]|nr:CoB--CoM heterodisulfide reductase iron-sulfur subunit B family protein [Planctomycetota bacterium]